MEHNAPHPSAVFEGYYSKFDLPSGAHIALVICQVQNAKTKPYMVSFTCVPKSGKNVYQKEIWAESINMTSTFRHEDCLLDVPGIGFVKWEGDRTEYEIRDEDFTFEASSRDRKLWSEGTSTPESLLVNLPLPLHWHVHSLESSCDFKLKIRSHEVPSEDLSGKALIHQEKNWANSFPSAHMWLQARNTSSKTSFCCAGGQILGLEAFLLGYRSPELDLDFRPPFSTRLPLVGGPFMVYESNWDERTFSLSVQSFTQKITVKASAPKGTFFSLSSPFPEGHRENYLGQSFKATIEVKVYQSSWGISPWKLVTEETFEEGSLEFGGGYYPPAGSEERYH